MSETKRNFYPGKEREYRLWLVWSNMSLPMKQIGEQYLDQEGINNPDIRELAGIKTQKELAEYLGIREATITEWKSQPIPDEYKDISWRNWLKEMKPEIVRLVTTGLRETKSPAHAKFLLELEGEYTQKSEIKIDGTDQLFEQLRTIAEQVKGDDQ